MKSESSFEKGRKLAYIELGEFLATFEHITHSFKDCISGMLHHKGLSDSNYSEILLNKLTAEPLKSILSAMIAHHFDEENQYFLNKVLSEYSNLIEIRNIVIHSFWAIGVGVEDYNKVSLIGIKTRNSKKGVEHYNLNFELSDIEEINSINKSFNELVYNIKMDIEKNNIKLKSKYENEFESGRFKRIINKLKTA